MLSLAQHPDYAQHLSVYAVSCTVCTREVGSVSVFTKNCFRLTYQKLQVTKISHGIRMTELYIVSCLVLAKMYS